MKVKDLILELQKLDKDRDIFLRNFMMCDTFEIHEITPEELAVWNEGTDSSNFGGYYIAENDEWLERNSV